MDDFSKIEFPLFLDRHLNFNREETYDFPLVNEGDLKDEPIVEKDTNFVSLKIRGSEFKFVMIKDKVGRKNLMYFYDGRWINISKLSTEFSLDEKFIKQFNKDLKKVQRYYG